ncbi:MAG: hypothetical protein LBT42_06560 [Tannerella sp.]|jgi:hypothetical protein|nr:hypothetical protein [Tannerella sp.]
MTRDELFQWIADSSLLTRDSLMELRQVSEEFPYFHAAKLLYLKNLAILNDVRLDKELKKMAIYVPDRRRLFMLLDDKRFAKNRLVLKKPEVAEPRKMEKLVVESSLEEKSTRKRKEAKGGAEKSKPAVAPPPVVASDYVSWLEENAEDIPVENLSENQIKHQELIDSFIENEKKQHGQRLPPPVVGKTSENDEKNEDFPESPVADKTSLDDSYFTETLARVYINQKRYDKALEIIRVLSLKYPEKNIYFADQIRYLEKIININK